MGGYRKVNIKHSGDFGFTLLELLIVLVIIGLVAAMVVPKVGGGVDGLKLKAETKKVAAALRHARSQAVSENRTFRAVIDPESHQIMIVADRSNRYPWDMKPEVGPPEIRFRLSIPVDIILELKQHENGLAPSPTGEIIFYSTGGSNGAMILVSGKRQHQFTLMVDDISGRIHILDGAPNITS